VHNIILGHIALIMIILPIVSCLNCVALLLFFAKKWVEILSLNRFTNNYLVLHCNDRSVIAPKSANWRRFRETCKASEQHERLCKFSTHLHWLQVLFLVAWTCSNRLCWNCYNLYFILHFICNNL